MNNFAWILVAWLLIGSAPVAADEPAGSAGIAWESLEEATQDLLAGQKANWNALPPERQRAMADGAQRWLSMDDEDRATARGRFQKWRNLTPAEREQVRERWNRFRDGYRSARPGDHCNGRRSSPNGRSGRSFGWS